MEEDIAGVGPSRNRNRYANIGRTISPLNWLFECRDCGCAVSNKSLHDVHHAALVRAASQARSADMWTRPLGGAR